MPKDAFYKKPKINSTYSDLFYDEHGFIIYIIFFGHVVEGRPKSECPKDTYKL
jgi:hypothetical protein